MASSEPDYVICLECESPCYEFTYKEGEVKEILCLVCGEEDPVMFLTEEDYEALAGAGH